MHILGMYVFMCMYCMYVYMVYIIFYYIFLLLIGSYLKWHCSNFVIFLYNKVGKSIRIGVRISSTSFFSSFYIPWASDEPRWSWITPSTMYVCLTTRNSSLKFITILICNSLYKYEWVSSSSSCSPSLSISLDSSIL